MYRITIQNTTPLEKELKLSAHQIPVSPRAVRRRIYAYGIRAPVSAMLIMLQSFVFPSPDKAPIVMLSMHMGAWQTATTLR